MTNNKVQLSRPEWRISHQVAVFAIMATALTLIGLWAFALWSLPTAYAWPYLVPASFVSLLLTGLLFLMRE